jgi:hypothetical protein
VSFAVITERLLAAAATAAATTTAIRVAAVESAVLLLTTSFQAIAFGRPQFMRPFSSLELYDASLCLRSVQSLEVFLGPFSSVLLFVLRRPLPTLFVVFFHLFSATLSFHQQPS